MVARPWSEDETWRHCLEFVDSGNQYCTWSPFMDDIRRELISSQAERPERNVWLKYISTKLYSSEAAAPVIISTNSPVMTAWRVLLNKIWYLLIMSPAFFEAFWTELVIWSLVKMQLLHTSIALRRADCSQAWPSARAQKRELASAYSRRLARTSSSISKAEKLA